jgi:hypothetical protein
LTAATFPKCLLRFLMVIVVAMSSSLKIQDLF